MAVTPQVVLPIALLVLSVTILITYVVRLYNGLIFMRNNAEKAFANIDVLLQQRFQEIPNQISLVEGATRHEKELLRHITNLRRPNNSVSLSPLWQQRLQHFNVVFSELKRISLHEEDYPRLTANDLFIHFQKRLVEINNIIAESREFYNECATLFNNRLMLIPNRQLMTPLGIVELELMHRFTPTKR